jgi:hypothetical protein
MQGDRTSATGAQFGRFRQRLPGGAGIAQSAFNEEQGVFFLAPPVALRLGNQAGVDIIGHVSNQDGRHISK